MNDIYCPQDLTHAVSTPNVAWHGMLVSGSRWLKVHQHLVRHGWGYSVSLSLWCLSSVREDFSRSAVDSQMTHPVTDGQGWRLRRLKPDQSQRIGLRVFDGVRGAADRLDFVDRRGSPWCPQMSDQDPSLGTPARSDSTYICILHRHVVLRTRAGESRSPTSQVMTYEEVGEDHIEISTCWEMSDGFMARHCLRPASIFHRAQDGESHNLEHGYLTQTATVLHTSASPSSPELPATDPVARLAARSCAPRRSSQHQSDQ